MSPSIKKHLTSDRLAKIIVTSLCLCISVVPSQGKPTADDQREHKPSPPNILVILTDDHRWDYLGCAGHPILKTPHIDQLAKEGTYFSNAFVTSASCTPNRTCILTGQYERKHGVTFGSQSTLKEEAFLDTYPMLLKKAGYFVGYVGKNHTPVGWIDTLPEPKTPIEKKQHARGGIDPQYHGYKSSVMEKHFDYWYGNHGHTGFYPKQIRPIYRNAQADTQPEILQEGALNFLNKNPEFTASQGFLHSKPADQPFCLLVNFNLPHTFSVNQMRQARKDPELYRSTYRDQLSNLPLPKTFLAEDAIQTPKLPKNVYNGEYISSYDFVKKEASLREQMVRSCQTVTGIDNLVGALVAELKSQNLYENTIILITSDHGLQFGEHGLGGKCLLYEESLRVPLIIRDPHAAEHAGHQPKKLATTLDVAPTLLDLAGLKPHPEMQGRSLRPLIYAQKPKDWRKDFFAENLFMGQNYPRIEAVRTTRYKYLRYFDKKKDKPHRYALTASIKGEQPIYEELYDLENDPHETTNLAQSSQHTETLKKLQTRCQTLVTQAKGNNDYPKTHLLEKNKKQAQ
jgi:arylsulfatase A-like enzyme